MIDQAPSIDPPTDASSRQSESGGWQGKLFSAEPVGRLLVIVLRINGNNFRYATLQTEVNALRRKLQHNGSIDGLVIDLHALNYMGSEAIGSIVALGRKAEDTGIRVVLCGVAPQLREALTNMNLDGLWPIYASRDDAVRAMQNNQNETRTASAE